MHSIMKTNYIKIEGLIKKKLETEGKLTNFVARGAGYRWESTQDEHDVLIGVLTELLLTETRKHWALKLVWLTVPVIVIEHQEN